jgi:hypothetical protein
VLENECERLEDSREMEEKMMSDSRGQAAMSGCHDRAKEGRREISEVEA